MAIIGRVPKDGFDQGEVLAYLREKDEADRKLTREQWALGTGDSRKDGRKDGWAAAIVVAIAVSIVAFIGGLLSFFALGHTTENPFIAIPAMTAFWVAGGIIAWLVLHFAGKKKNVSPPDA